MNLKKNILAINFIIIFIILSGCILVQQEKPIEIDDEKRTSNPKRNLLTNDEQYIVFGYDRRLEPKEDVKIYNSLLKYLEKETGYKFKIHVTKKSIIDEVKKNKIDIVAVGTLSYLILNKDYNFDIIAKGLNSKNEGKYKAVIITRPESNISNIKDLNDKAFAFGDYNSTQGHLIPRIMLAQENIGLEMLARYDYMLSHSEVANAVMSGKYDAGGLQDTLAIMLANKGLVKIIGTSDLFPSSGIAFNKDIDKEKIIKIRNALLNLKPQKEHQKYLYQWESTEMPNGFMLATDEDYNVLRNWAEKFGMLDLNQGE